MSITITARCVSCGELKPLTENQIKEAEETGCPMCENCFMPMVVESAESTSAKKNKSKKS